MHSVLHVYSSQKKADYFFNVDRVEALISYPEIVITRDSNEIFYSGERHKYICDKNLINVPAEDFNTVIMHDDEGGEIK